MKLIIAKVFLLNNFQTTLLISYISQHYVELYIAQILENMEEMFWKYVHMHTLRNKTKLHVLFYCLLKSRRIYSPSHTGIGGSHSSGETMGSNAPQDQVVYSEPLQDVTLPNLTSASRQQYDLSTKAVNKSSQEQLASRKSRDVPDIKSDSQVVSSIVSSECFIHDKFIDS